MYLLVIYVFLTRPKKRFRQTLGFFVFFKCLFMLISGLGRARYVRPFIYYDVRYVVVDTA